MLKAILFVLFIVITFDIGVSIIEHFDEQSVVEADMHAEESPRPSEENQPMQVDSLDGAGAEEKPSLDLSIPEDVQFDDHSADYETVQEAKPSATNGKRQLDLEQKPKSSGFRAKPIVDIEGGIDKPQVDGATIEWKKEL